MAPVAHAVAVGAQAREVIELGLTGSGDVEGSDVVHFDVILAEAPVRVGEVEAADLALQCLAAALNLLDLQLAKLGVPLTEKRPTSEESSLHPRGAGVVGLIWLWRDQVQFARIDTVTQGLGGLQHFCFTLGESRDHAERGCSASSRLALVGGMVRGEVGSLATDAVGRAVARERESFWGLERQRPQQLGQLLNLAVARAQLVPAVLHDKGSGEEQLIVGPRGIPRRHREYRMSVRRGGGRVQRTVQRAAHLVESRCQWGLSPSVMVDCKMRLPLHVCKEGA